MSNVAVIHSSPSHTEPYLGPAEVLAVEPHRVHLKLPTAGAVWAQLALAFSYEPQTGDQLLVIGNADGHYVIGVLQGRGTARMTFPGDVELRSTGGSVRVAAAEGVEIEAPQVALRARRVQLFARSMVEQLGNLYQTVTEVLNVRAGAAHTMVEGTSYTQAKRATLLTENEVNINGKKINLG